MSYSLLDDYRTEEEPCTFGGENSQTILLPIELKDINDGADSGDDVLIQHWDASGEIGESNIAWIDAHTSDTNDAPRMPQLVFSAPGLPDGVTLEAKFEVDYTRGNGGKPHEDQDLVKIPSSGFKTVTDGVWEIYADYPSEFFGGEAKLVYKINGQAEQTISFRVAGENPDNTRCRDHIVSVSGDHTDYAYVIAKSESRIGSKIYNQFKDDSGAATKPNWHDDSPSLPGGYGLGQISGTPSDENAIIPREQIWNWQKNVDALINFLDSKRSLASNFLTGERSLAQANGHQNSIPNIDLPRSERDASPNTIRDNTGSYCSSTYNGSGGNRSNGNPSGDVKVTLTNSNVLDFMTMKTYNGSKAHSPAHDNGTGFYCVYRTADQDWEFRRRKSISSVQPSFWHITYVTRVTAEYEDLNQPSPGD